MKEGEFITGDILKKEWANTLATYDLFIKGGHELRPVRLIIRHIIDKGYDRVLFPGTSMYSLLISMPIDNKVNFNNTLKIGFEHLTDELKFQYIDRTKGKIEWEETCQAAEGRNLLESFLATRISDGR